LHPATRRQQVQVHADFAAAAADLGRHSCCSPLLHPPARPHHRLWLWLVFPFEFRRGEADWLKCQAAGRQAVPQLHLLRCSPARCR
jgi:hypothetical protein